MKAYLWMLLTTATFLFGAAGARGQEREIDELRARAREYVQRAEQLEQAGNPDDAQAYVERAERLSREADEIAERRRDIEADRERERDAVGDRHEIERLTQELKELSESHQPDHPRLGELRRHIHALRERQKELQIARQEDQERIQMHARMHAEQLAHARRERGELERRHHHLHVAAENLHAAGMHELAEQVAAEARETEARLHEIAHDPFGGGHPEHHPLAEQVEHLQRQVDELRKIVERLAREKE